MAYRPSKNVFLLGLTSFFNDLSSEMVLSVMPAFFISVLKTGAGALGFVEGVADAAANIIKIYSGRLSDKIQKRRLFLFLGYSLSVLTRPLYLIVGNVFHVAGLRVVDRIGKGLRDSPRDAIISLSTSDGETGRAFGFHRAIDTLGGILGPLIAYIILKAYPGGFNTVFITAFIVGLCAVLTIFFVTDLAQKTRDGVISRASFRNFPGSFKRYIAALFFLSVGSIPVAVLLLKTQHVGLALASIPLFYLLYNMSYAGFSFSAGSMSDKVGAKKVIFVGYLLLIAGYIFLALAETTAFLIVGFLVIGLFPALTDGVARAFASELSSESERGGAFGYVNAISGIGLLLGGIVGGFLWQQFSPEIAFICATIVVCAGLGILSTVHPTTKESRYI